MSVYTGRFSYQRKYGPVDNERDTQTGFSLGLNGYNETKRKDLKVKNRPIFYAGWSSEKVFKEKLKGTTKVLPQLSLSAALSDSINT